MKTFKSYLTESDEQVYIHYSNHPNLVLLTGIRSGTGIKGAEQERLKQTGDWRIKQRVYFYPKPKDGYPQPEQGLGPHMYQARLINMYDPINAPDPEVDRLKAHYISTGEHPSNAFERAVLDKGYHGYHGRGMSVALNKDVRVSYLGTKEGKNLVPVNYNDSPKKTSFVQTQPNALGEHESAMLEPHQMEFFQKNRDQLQQVAPSLKLQYGRLNVKASHFAALRQHLDSLSGHPL